MTIDKQVARLRELLPILTGDWQQMAGLPTNVLNSAGLRVARCDYDGEMDNPECGRNAEFITLARNAMPALLDELDRLRAHKCSASMGRTYFRPVFKIDESEF